MASLYSRVSEKRKTLLVLGSVFAAVILVSLGVFASNGWLPQTDPFSGKRYGWFGKEVAKNAPSSWNPIAMPPPSPTPQLSREYIYAGSRLLAVEDANANAAPPTDLAVWRPTTGTWYVLEGAGWSQTDWGQANDIPVPGDYDGDGKTDFSVFRPDGVNPDNNYWYIKYSSDNSISSYIFGTSNDVPAPADYDGDGKTDSAVYRPSTGYWYILGTTAGFYSQQWGGTTGDVPAAADYDGDGKGDLAVWRPGDRKFYIRNSYDNSLDTFDSGIASGTYEWKAVSSDFDGDGKADAAVYDKDAANWYVRSSISGTFNTPFQWGSPEDTPVHNDYDADGKVDYAVWTNSGPNTGRWHIRNSSDTSTRNVTWGIQNDIPVPAYYKH